MSKPENPSAFPNTGNNVWSLTPEAGMTLRDWFAGQFMASAFDLNREYAKKVGGSYSIAEATARDAYEQADAMLAERARAQGGAA